MEEYLLILSAAVLTGALKVNYAEYTCTRHSKGKGKALLNVAVFGNEKHDYLMLTNFRVFKVNANTSIILHFLLRQRILIQVLCGVIMRVPY